ncbi:MscS Mechanosensitive ion channel [Sporocytophaga myxococcoides]|uniref:MscS Mechanosensitive ion channel n=1 Tax=Sporocytophaga myxococcoides TaxID=153721 RepID=A0A098LEF0_9BACT|nr:hypothetical protein [Sporocytophaga myxococcoides]GAL85290.1 MscS Mechanosensitive ion channel [Sporocytophaga myxococcoides]
MSFSSSYIHQRIALLVVVSYLFSCESSKKTSTGSETTNYNEKGNIEVPDEYAISKERVGNLTIDMPIGNIFSYYDKSQVKKSAFTSEGQKFEAYFIKTSRDTSRYLRIDPICTDSCKIWRIKVYDKRYKTRSGLGIGSKVGEIKSYHYIDWAGNTEDGPAFGLERLGITFLIDSTSLPATARKNIDVETLSDSAKVAGILITKGHSQ